MRRIRSQHILVLVGTSHKFVAVRAMESGRKNDDSLRVTGKALPESIAPRIRDRHGVVAGLRREWYIIKYKL